MDNIHMFLNAQDLSLQEMLDTDMRTEIDNVFGHSDLSLSLSDLPPLDLDESLGGPCDMPMWFTSSVLSGRGADSDSCDSNFNLDLVGNDGAGKMVDPTSVMPCLTTPAYPAVGVFEPTPVATTTTTTMKFVVDASRQNIRVASFATDNKVKMATHAMQINGGIRTLNGGAMNGTNGSHHVVVKKSVNNFSKHFHNGAVSADADFDDLRLYPKPAYSYSCLIAMALKNSATGSLPVSEIYNFMCEHFPYFKTAPNGWKNSVRHNLSLNKCFEKIEKPAGNGSQRKGCLWAMNPGKIAKMDEEVQKWSKKDPLAIKKAMINPGSLLKKATVSLPEPTANISETLDLLERGDLKRDFAPASTSSGGSVSEDSDDDAPQRRSIKRPPSDDQDSSSDQDDYDIEVGDGMFEEEEDDEDEDSKLGLGLTFTAAPSELLGISLASSARLITTQQQATFAGKRAKVAASIHGNYVYKPMTGGWDSVADRKRKPPLLLRGSGGSIGSSLIKVDDSL